MLNLQPMVQKEHIKTFSAVVSQLLPNEKEKNLIFQMKGMSNNFSIGKISEFQI